MKGGQDNLDSWKWISGGHRVEVSRKEFQILELERVGIYVEHNFVDTIRIKHLIWIGHIQRIEKRRQLRKHVVLEANRRKRRVITEFFSSQNMLKSKTKSTLEFLIPTYKI